MKQNAVISYLVGLENQDIIDLDKSLYLLFYNFNHDAKYPVVIFHESNLTKEIQQYLEMRYDDLDFIEIELKTPDHIDLKSLPEIVAGSKIGYRNMIRFVSLPMYVHEKIKDYEYYWRIDTDSFLLDHIEKDPFEVMKENDLTYGYQVIYKEQPFACVGFADFIDNYIKQNNITPTFPQYFNDNNRWGLQYYYSDFEICRLDFRLSEGYEKWFDHVDQSGIIYSKRIGDTLITSVYIFMMLEESKTKQFKEIAWLHQDYRNEGI